VDNESAAVQAVIHLADETKPDDDVWLIIFTACSFVVFFLLGLGKWYISNKVNSSSLKKVATRIATSMPTLQRAVPANIRTVRPFTSNIATTIP